MIWFTADTHFDHTNILKYQAATRPWPTVEAMNQGIVSCWNNVVNSGDTVYHLGDFAFRNHSYWRSRLNGNIVLVEGSHDRMAGKDKRQFNWVGPMHVVKSDPDIILCHYAMRTWPRSHYGTWHLFGHSHGALPPFGKSFDVGVDAWGMRPISLDEVVAKMPTLIIVGGVDSRYEEEPR